MVRNAQNGDRSLRVRAVWCASLLGLLWLVELADVLEGGIFYTWGILPRTRIGLRGVLFAPFIHQSPEHLALNSLPLALLAWLVLARGTRAFLRVSLTVLVAGGLGVWVIGRPQYHIGASGLVLGYFGFLVASSVYERSWSSLLLAAVAVLFYGGLVLGIFPGEAGVSWESHLCGLLAGVFAAWTIKGKRGR